MGHVVVSELTFRNLKMRAVKRRKKKVADNDILKIIELGGITSEMEQVRVKYPEAMGTCKGYL